MTYIGDDTQDLYHKPELYLCAVAVSHHSKQDGLGFGIASLGRDKAGSDTDQGLPWFLIDFLHKCKGLPFDA